MSGPQIYSLEDLALEICTAMAHNGIIAVLTGDGLATIYAPDANESQALHFTLPLGTPSPCAETLRAITDGVYRSPDHEFTVEFLEGPITVGEEVIQAWSTWHREDQILYLLTPTDCVRDRLAAAIREDDLDPAQQAAEVAKRHPVDMDLIQKWCEREGGARTYALFRHLILV
jgi:hypothetical protein